MTTKALSEDQLTGLRELWDKNETPNVHLNSKKKEEHGLWFNRRVFLETYARVSSSSSSQMNHDPSNLRGGNCTDVEVSTPSSEEDERDGSTKSDDCRYGAVEDVDEEESDTSENANVNQMSESLSSNIESANVQDMQFDAESMMRLMSTSNGNALSSGQNNAQRGSLVKERGPLERESSLSEEAQLRFMSLDRKLRETNGQGLLPRETAEFNELQRLVAIEQGVFRQALKRSPLITGQTTFTYQHL